MEKTRFRNELQQLITLKELLDDDKVLPISFEVNRKSLDFQCFEIVIHGLSCLIINMPKKKEVRNFYIDINIPPGYPWEALPHIYFTKNIPFHPNVYTSGSICWGKLGTSPQPDLHLVDWFGLLIDFLQYTHDREGLIVLDEDSAANRSASSWWNANRIRIDQFITKIDLARLRFWIDKSRV